jgi:hypothetical protein
MRALVILALAGCSNADKPECERTIATAHARVASESVRVGMQTSIVGERGKLAMIASCESEPWPAEVVRCFESARLEVDLAGCTKKLTQEQYERLQTKLAGLQPSPPVYIPYNDASVPLAIIDAGVVIDAPLHARAPGDAAEPSCETSIVNPRSARCRKQFCTTHVNDVRCQVE